MTTAVGGDDEAGGGGGAMEDWSSEAAEEGAEGIAILPRCRERLKLRVVVVAGSPMWKTTIIRSECSRWNVYYETRKQYIGESTW